MNEKAMSIAQDVMEKTAQLRLQPRTVTIDIKPGFFFKKDNRFVIEKSEVDLGATPRTLILRNPKTRNTVEFEYYKMDWADPTHEDIAGWWYHSRDRRYQLLLIND